MESRTVWTVNYHDCSGNMHKAEYFCQSAQKARQMFRARYKASAGYMIVSILDWREDLRNERRNARKAL